MRIPKCKSPLPFTVISVLSFLFSSTPSNYKATSLSASMINLYFITFLDIFLPSLPAMGEVFTLIETDMIGGSIGIEGITS